MMITNRNISVITDADNKKIVFINDIRFKGKRKVNWEEVKEYYTSGNDNHCIV